MARQGPTEVCARHEQAALRPSRARRRELRSTQPFLSRLCDNETVAIDLGAQVYADDGERLRFCSASCGMTHPNNGCGFMRMPGVMDAASQSS
jgi:hypothetical protein